MINKKVFKSLDELNEFNTNNEVRIISISEKISHSTGETGSYPPKYVSVTETKLTVWYEEKTWQKANN